MRRAALACARWTVLAALLAVPSGAVAAVVDTGPGRDARVAVDIAGAAHIVSSETISGLGDVIHYCRVDEGTTACAARRDFTYPEGPQQGGDSGHYPLLPGGSRVLVLTARCCTNYARKFLYSSSDGGQSFDAGVDIGAVDFPGGIGGSALFTGAGVVGRPAESILTFGSGGTAGAPFQATGTSGPPEAGSGTIVSGDLATNGTLGLTGNTLVAAWRDLDDSLVYWRQWSGAGDVNDAASWMPITPVDTTERAAAPKLAYGPSGIYLAYITGPGSGDRVMVRKFTGSGWGPPTRVIDVGVDFDVFEDPSGVLHLAWSEDGSLMYRRATSPANADFTAARTLQPAGSYSSIRLGVAASGKGWVVWDPSQSGGHVFSAPLAPLPPPIEGKTVNATPAKGRVLVKLPGTRRFVRLEALGRQVPVGSTFDTTKGTVQLSLATNTSGRTQDGSISMGSFRVLQSRKNPLTTLSMTGGGLGACSRLPRGGAPKAVAVARSRSRSLFSNVRGRFRTRGRNSVATVRGTSYLVKDTCSGTLTKVRTGRVVVRDLTLRRNKVLRAGQSYFARALKRR